MFSNNTEELAQNKMILLYIIHEAPYSFNKNTLNDFVLERNYMNYFLLQQYLGELIESDFLNLVSDNGSEDIYKISERGELLLEYFDNKIPTKLKEELKEEFHSQQILERKEAQVVSDYFPKEDGQYIVNLKLVENEETLFSLYIDVASEEQAEIVCKSWREKTDDIYISIINMLTEE